MSENTQKMIDDLKTLPDIRKEIDSLSDKKYQQSQRTVNMLYAIDSKQAEALYNSYNEFDVKRKKRIADLKAYVAKTEKDSFDLVVSLSKKNKNSSAKELLTNIEQYSSKQLSDLSLKERINSEIAKFKKKKKVILSISIPVFVILLIFASYFYMIPQTKYFIAEKAFKNGEYEQAVATFSSIETFNDSSKRLTQSKYALANLKLDQKNYEEALNIYNEINDYKDSEIKSKECIYFLAIQYRNEKRFDDSIDYLLKIADYKDSSDQLKETRYQKAVDLYDGDKSYDKDKKEAVSLFCEFYGYKDSTDYINYHNGLSADDIDGAISAFSTVSPDFKDVSNRIRFLKRIKTEVIGKYSNGYYYDKTWLYGGNSPRYNDDFKVHKHYSNVLISLNSVSRSGVSLNLSYLEIATIESYEGYRYEKSELKEEHNFNPYIEYESNIDYQIQPLYFQNKSTSRDSDKCPFYNNKVLIVPPFDVKLQRLNN